CSTLYDHHENPIVVAIGHMAMTALNSTCRIGDHRDAAALDHHGSHSGFEALPGNGGDVDVADHPIGLTRERRSISRRKVLGRETQRFQLVIPPLGGRRLCIGGPDCQPTALIPTYLVARLRAYPVGDTTGARTFRNTIPRH